MKSNKLKVSKLDAMLKFRIENLSQILGGGRFDMSSHKINGTVTATDSADLTCTHGSKWLFYEGKPGDGHAGDWTDGKWSDGGTYKLPPVNWV